MFLLLEGAFPGFPGNHATPGIIIIIQICAGMGHGDCTWKLDLHLFSGLEHVTLSLFNSLFLGLPVPTKILCTTSALVEHTDSRTKMTVHSLTC